MRFSSQVVLKLSAGLIAITSIVGCGSGAAKPFSAVSSTDGSSPVTAAAGSNTSSSSNSSGTSSSGTSTAGAPPVSTFSAPAPAPAPAPSSSPATPAVAGAQVYASLQSQPGWQTCGGCGNEGGTGTGPNYNMTQNISNPSLSGRATDFYVNGGPAYTGGYYFIEQPVIPNPVTYLQYDFDLFVPGQYANTPQALEFECQQTVNGFTYNFAWQADYATNLWRVFNYTTKVWEPTSIQLQRFAPDKWHHITAIYHAAGTQVIHDAIIVDGQRHNANITHEATQTGTRDEFTAAFQVDLNAASNPYHVFVDNLKASFKD